MSSISVSSAETVANIEDLLTQILESLPLPSLYRFKCVSKHWLSLIAELKRPKISGFFSSNNTTEDPVQFIPLIGNREISSSSDPPFKTLHKEIQISLLHTKPHFDILQSCNGLFLCHARAIQEDYIIIDRQNIYLVNPTTNQLLPLSPPSIKNKRGISGRDIRYGLAFDPSKSPHYDVVCVIAEYMKKLHKIDIYSSRTGHWKSYMHFDYTSGEGPAVYCNGPVYCNGAIHWIREERGERVLQYYDIGLERLLDVAPVVKNNILLQANLKVSPPPLFHRYFGESGSGHLYLIEMYEFCRTKFEVMEMERDYSAWVVKYFVDLNPVLAALHQHDSKAFVVLNFSREQERDNYQEEDSSSLLLHVPGKVISYNCRNKSFKTCVELNNKGYKELILAENNYPYMKSLVFV